MTKIITFIAILICSYVSAQTIYETEMTTAISLWTEGKNADAVVIFEKAAALETKEWLPSYYVAFINALSSFETKDKAQAKSMLETAQKALNLAFEKESQNAELYVLQGLIYTAWIVSDPMTNGMKYSGLANNVYVKAEKLAPENPRVVLSKAEFDKGSAEYFGEDTTVFCSKFKKSVELFSTFKPTSPFHPNWGLDRAIDLVENCK